MYLMIFAAVLACCMVPVGLAARRDPRTFRGVSVWAKPLKFLAALALFAATTAVLMRAAGPAAPLTGIAASSRITTPATPCTRHSPSSWPSAPSA